MHESLQMWKECGAPGKINDSSLSGTDSLHAVFSQRFMPFLVTDPHPHVLYDFLVTVKAAPYECVIRTGLTYTYNVGKSLK